MTLVPNEAYWGDKAKSTVVFQFLADTAAEFQAFKAGEVLAIYPQPQIDVIEAIDAGITDAETAFTGDTGNLEALWINMAKPPFDSQKFRQAFAYSIDRDVGEAPLRWAGDQQGRELAQPADPGGVQRHEGVRGTS